MGFWGVWPAAVFGLAVEAREDLAGADEAAERDDEEAAASLEAGGEDEGTSRIADGEGILMLSISL